MSITVNGQSRVPPGFRFHPTEEELLNYYLRKKVACEKIDLDVIRDVDLNKLEPWDIQEKCRIGSTPQNDWYFFSHKDKKYPTGTRTNRATTAGFWKATGRDKVIYTSSKRIGMRKTLVFYKGRAPHGQKSDWIMHEYRLDDHHDSTNSQTNPCCSVGEGIGQEDGWVVCRVFKKRNYNKSLDSPNNSSSATSDGKAQALGSGNDRALDQILQCMGRSCKQENDSTANKAKINLLDNNSCNTTTTTTLNNISTNNSYMKYLLPLDLTGTTGSALLEKFMCLPGLESPSVLINECTPILDQSFHHTDPSLHDWATVDRLVASHLNGQSEESKSMSCFDDNPNYPFCSSTSNRLLTAPQDYTHGDDSDMDLWAFTASASSNSGSDHIGHTSE